MSICMVCVSQIAKSFALLTGEGQLIHLVDDCNLYKDLQCQCFALFFEFF